jgi:hypothetical protein
VCLYKAYKLEFIDIFAHEGVDEVGGDDWLEMVSEVERC